MQKIYQCPVSRIGEVLHIVGLENTGRKKTGQFSLGMKQRLGIAIALLHNPSLLILDEPTNGLDPNGIIELRALLKKLNEENKMTILISSHLLSEIEKLVTHLGIIQKGKLLFQGKLDELYFKQQISSVILWETSRQQQTADIMQSLGLAPAYINDQLTIPLVEKSVLASLNKKLVEEGIDVYQISLKKTILNHFSLTL